MSETGGGMSDTKPPDAGTHLSLDNELVELMVRVGGEAMDASPASRNTGDLETHLRILLAFSPAVIYTCGSRPDYPTTYISDNVRTDLGYTPADFYGDPFFWSKHIHPDDLPSVLEKLAAIGKEGRIAYEYRVRHKDGHYRWHHDQVVALSCDDDDRVLALIGCWLDVTDRKHAEAVQVTLNRVFKSILSNASLQNVLTELVYGVESHATGMLGSVLIYDSAEDCLHLGAAPSLPNAYNEAIDGISIGPRVGSCGTAAYLKQRVIVEDTQRDPLWASFRETAAKAGLMACWSQPVIGTAGELLGTFALYYREKRGPTDYEIRLIEEAANIVAVAIENHSSRRKLRQASRLASIGTLAAGIAHEINNPLTGIILAAQRALASKNLDTDAPDVRKALENIVGDADRCTKIVKGVLQFARNEQPQPIQCNVVELVAEAIRLVETQTSERHVNIKCVSEGDLPSVNGNSTQLVQVFVNLLQNAIEASEPNGDILVRSQYTIDGVVIQIEDRGRGMSKNQQERVFDPFFTSRALLGGSGLGLSICHGIILSHGGRISIASELGLGTKITVTLPLAATIHS